MQKITPFLWFDGNAEEAANFYTSTFKNSKMGKITYYGEAGPGLKGSVLTVSFQLEGQEFVALNGGPIFKPTEAVSFVVSCATQKELDHYWEKLSRGGRKIECGWLKDRYGLSWQVTPVVLGRMLASDDRSKAARVTQAFLRMKKFDIAALERAYNGA